MKTINRKKILLKSAEQQTDNNYRMLIIYLPSNLTGLRGMIFFLGHQPMSKNKEKIFLDRLPIRAFICGGSKKSHVRQKFIDYITRKKLLNNWVVVAEDLKKLWDKNLSSTGTNGKLSCVHENLLYFEKDIAKLSKVIPIFAESPGSLVELGAFFENKDLKKRLLVIIKKEYVSEESFIKGAILDDPSISQEKP